MYFLKKFVLNKIWEVFLKVLSLNAFIMGKIQLDVVINMSTEDQDNDGPPIMFVFGRVL